MGSQSLPFSRATTDSSLTLVQTSLAPLCQCQVGLTSFHACIQGPSQTGPCQIAYPQLSPSANSRNNPSGLSGLLAFWAMLFCLFTCPLILCLSRLHLDASPGSPPGSSACPSLPQEHFCASLAASTLPTVVLLILVNTQVQGPLPTRPQQLPSSSRAGLCLSYLLEPVR